MPQAIPFIVAAVKAVSVKYVLVTLAKMAAYALINKLTARKPGANSLPINVTIRSTIAPRRLILGRVRAGGAVCFVRTSDTNSKYLWYVIAYAGHQCDALGDVWLDKQYIPSADINAGTGAVSTTALDGKLMIWSHLGTGAQTVDTNLDTAFTVWTSNHRLRGICYDVFRFEKSNDAWPTGAPQMVNRVVDGSLVYDPRLDSTNGGAGSHRRDDPQTWEFSRNWALIVRHYLSGGSVVNDQASRLIRYGLKEDDSRIDDAYTIAAANISDQSLSGANAPPSGAQVRYTCDIEASCDQPRREILEDIRACGGPGQLVYLHGKWRIYAAAYDAPSHTMTQDMLVGEIETEDTVGEEDRFNAISALYIDAAKEYTEQTSPVRTNATYIAQDAGEEKQQDIVLRGVTDQYRAQRITELVLRQSRQMRIVRLPFNRSGLAIAPNETFTMDHTRYGWSGRLFRCLEREVMFNEEGGMYCMITAKQEVSTVYTDLATADYTTGTSIVNSVQSEAPDAPTGLTAITLPRAIEFNWTLGEFWAQNGISELWEYSANTPFASATKIWEGRANRAIIQKIDTTPRYYWVRIRTIADQTSSTEPSGNGLIGVAAGDPAVITDWDFELATDTSWWIWFNAETGTSTAATGVSISASGGVSAGKMVLVGDSTDKYVYAKRLSAYRVVTGQQFSMRLRWRRTGAISSASGADLLLQALMSSSFSHVTTAAPADVVNWGGITVSNTTLNAATVNQWQESSATATISNHPKSSTQAPNLLVAIVMPSACTSGTIEIDSFVINPI